MFGYIKPDIQELKVRENELYKATYCGLCKSMGKNTGCFSNFTLSYDFVFLSLFRMVLTKEKAEFKMGRCGASPFKKKPIMVGNEALKFSAQASTILTRLKLKDNINDSQGFAKTKAKMKGSVSVFLKKTDKSLLPLEKKISSCIDDLSRLEKENSSSIDLVADTFGRLLGELISYELTGSDVRVAYEIGYHLGKWIYVIDAFDDFYDDQKSKSYNVLVNAYGSELSEENVASIESALILELDSMLKAVNLVDFTGYLDIENLIKNIIYLGMPKEFKRLKNSDRRTKHKRRTKNEKSL